MFQLLWKAVNIIRYITSNAQNRIPVFLQLFMWNLVDEMNIENRDYFQIFELTVRDGNQHIKHFQEQPEYSKEYTILCDNPLTEKVYIIIEDDYQTMLLAEDY